jgi:uncharacterized protein YbjQ (UPF0145 family)
MAQVSTTVGLPMTTALEFTGLQITETLGVVYGLVVRRHAIDRMVDNARLMDADGLSG